MQSVSEILIHKIKIGQLTWTENERRTKNVIKREIKHGLSVVVNDLNMENLSYRTVNKFGYFCK